MRREWSGQKMECFTRQGLRFSILGCFISLGGCAGYERYQAGQRFMEAGQPDEAIVAFQDALEEDPTNAHYQLNLTDAEAAAADKHVLQAEQHLSNRQPKEAKDELLLALELMPGHPRAAVLMNEVNAELGHPATQPAPVAAAPATKPAVTVVSAAQAPPPKVAKKESAPPPAPLSPPPVALKRMPAEAPPAKVKSARPVAVSQDVFQGTISRDDDRFPKQLETLDGIVIKLNDTSDKPLRADIEVRVGQLKRDYKDLRIGTRINGRGGSRAAYRLIILEIDDIHETVSFAVEPIAE